MQSWSSRRDRGDDRRQLSQRCSNTSAVSEGFKINYVEPDAFDRTGSAYSLWLGVMPFFSGDCFLLKGDVFFEEDALRYLIAGQAPDVAAVASAGDLMEGSAVQLTDSGFITGFRMKQPLSRVEALHLLLLPTELGRKHPFSCAVLFAFETECFSAITSKDRMVNKRRYRG